MSLSDSPAPDPSPAVEGAIVGKILVRLIPFLALLYVFCLLDRGNVGVAALTMKKDLQFGDTIYGLGAGIFFVGYFIFEVPSNLLMEKVGARRWIARIMLTWGLISAAMMFVRTPTSFYVLRFLLGLAEAGFYPGILLYLTYWVPARARARVLSRFLALSAVMGLVGGPLGGLLLKLNGWHGLAGWQWLFLLEGLPSALMAFVVLRVLPNSPQNASWLTPNEKAWLVENQAREALSTTRMQHISIRSALQEPRLLSLCAIMFVSSTAGNAVGFFAPQLIKARSGDLWTDSFVSTISVIPAIVGAAAMIIAAVHSDRTGNRRGHVIVGYFIGGLGYLLCVFMPSAEGILLALSLNALGERIAAGSYWAVTTNLMGARAAAGGIAFINSVGNLGGFFGPVMMGELKKHSLTLTGDGYGPGLYVAAALMFATSLVSYITLRRFAPDPAPVAAPGLIPAQDAS